MDKIFLKGLKVETIIGIWEWERSVKQTIRIDLEIGTDVRKVAAADSIESALNYRDVSKRLISYVGSSKYFMVELSVSLEPVDINLILVPELSDIKK